VPSAPTARRCVTAVPTTCVGGEIQLFSPSPTDGEGVCPLLVGVEEAGTETPRVGGDQGLAVLCRSEAIDRVGAAAAPEPVEVCEALLTQPIAVLEELECVREEICTHVEVPGNPFERQQKPVCVLEVEDKDHQSLEVGVRGPARQEIAPLASPCCKRGGDYPPLMNTQPRLSMTTLCRPPLRSGAMEHSVDTKELSER
jgi:hypothetical protein